MEHWTKPALLTDLKFKTCYYTEDLRHADPGWDAYFASVIATDPMIRGCIERADDDAYYSEPPHTVFADFTYTVHPEDHRWKPPFLQLVDRPVWVAWRGEPNPGKVPTKIPYRGIGRKAASNAPKTWLTFAQAEAVAGAAGFLGEHGLGGGVGIMLGPVAGLIGVDLDTCRDPETGEIEPWAAEVIERLGSYAEVSPSRTGVKIFALAADLPAMQALLGGQTGREFKRCGAAHPPGIEVYIDRRYFTVTAWRLGDAELRSITIADFRWLIEEAGPRIAGKADKAGRDESRSAVAFRLGAALRRQGKTFEEMVAALRADPETAEWVEEKGDANGQRELHRIWERADPHTLSYFALTEDGVALAFAAKFADQLKYCHHKGAWYEWGWYPLAFRRNQTGILLGAQRLPPTRTGTP